MTPALDPPLGSDLSREHRVVLQTIYNTWSQDVQWPRTQWIDRILDREHDGMDLQKILPTIPERYILFNRYSPTDAELKLTVAGTASCENSGGDIQLFMRVLRWCTAREKDFQPSSPTKEEELRLTGADLQREWNEAGLEVSPRILEKAFALADVEQLHRGSQRSAEPSDWNLLITRTIRPYREAHSFEEYLAIKEQLRRDAMAQAPSYVTGLRTIRSRYASSPLIGDAIDALTTPALVGVAEEEEDGDDGGRDAAAGDRRRHVDDDRHQLPVLSLDDLHPIVLDACRRRVERGHHRDGVLHAILAYRDLVKARSGLNDDDDTRLMGRAFGGKSPALVVADLSTETGRNLQRGMAHLSEGLLAFVRNPLTHNAAEIEPVAAMRMLALVDTLVRAVDERPDATPSPPPPAVTSADAG